MGSRKGRGNQYIQFVRVLYSKLPTNGKQLPALPLEAVPGTEPRPQRWEARVLSLCHHGPLEPYKVFIIYFFKIVNILDPDCSSILQFNSVFLQVNMQIPQLFNQNFIKSFFPFPC